MADSLLPSINETPIRAQAPSPRALFTPNTSFLLTGLLEPNLQIHYPTPSHAPFIALLFNSPHHSSQLPWTTAKAHAWLTAAVPSCHAKNGWGQYIVSLTPELNAQKHSIHAQTASNEATTTTTATAGNDDQDCYVPGTAVNGLIPVGIVTLMRGEHYPAPDIGFHTLPPYRGRGYTTAAAIALLAHFCDPWPFPFPFPFPAISPSPSPHETRATEQPDARAILRIGVFGFCDPENEAS
jgi:RimJ/RimL family protein N-acetyltransferase